MLSLHSRIDLLARLGDFLQRGDEEWGVAKRAAVAANPWFTYEGVEAAAGAIAERFLQLDALQGWAAKYTTPTHPKTVGIVMAGNIPLVGFHDFLCGFVSGHRVRIKLSSKDARLLPFLFSKMLEWEPAMREHLEFADMLKGCDAYIATGSNNTARYFHEYFGKYPSIIRKNRTSVAVLQGDESAEELSRLSDDVFAYYGLGCRNVTQVCVPDGYNFEPLLKALDGHSDLMLHHKYKNNYDYHLALYLLNKVPYLTNESVLLVENALPFSAVATLHYRFYSDRSALLNELRASEDIQAIIGHDGIPFGEAQKPSLTDYADGMDTMAFLCSL